MYKKLVLMLVLVSLAGLLAAAHSAQTSPSVMNGVRDAIRAGNSRELTRHFNDMVELTIMDKSGNYTKEQATFVLKEFFDKNPPTSFSFIHQGASGDGTQYAIGRYAWGSGGSYRIFMLVKKGEGNTYKVKLLNIAEE
jgi:hypothetical protein